MNLLKIAFSCIVLSMCFLWARDAVFATRLHLICIRDCDYEYEEFEISPVRVLYDGREVKLSEHYAEMSTKYSFGDYEFIRGEADWSSQEYALPEDEQNPRKPNIHFDGQINPPSSITAAVRQKIESIRWSYNVYKIEHLR